MFFKKRKIEKLTIKVAKYKALSEVSERFTKGSTNSYFIDKHLNNVACLAVAEEELRILKGDT
jgi:hypothetical protein